MSRTTHIRQWDKPARDVDVLANWLTCVLSVSPSVLVPPRNNHTSILPHQIKQVKSKLSIPQTQVSNLPLGGIHQRLPLADRRCVHLGNVTTGGPLEAYRWFAGGHPATATRVPLALPSSALQRALAACVQGWCCSV